MGRFAVALYSWTIVMPSVPLVHNPACSLAPQDHNCTNRASEPPTSTFPFDCHLSSLSLSLRVSLSRNGKLLIRWSLRSRRSTFDADAGKFDPHSHDIDGSYGGGGWPRPLHDDVSAGCDREWRRLLCLYREIRQWWPTNPLRPRVSWQVYRHVAFCSEYLPSLPGRCRWSKASSPHQVNSLIQLRLI